MKYNFTTGEELLAMCNKFRMPIYSIMIRREAEVRGTDIETIILQMKEALGVMKSSIENGIKNTSKSVGGLIGGEALKLGEYIKKGNTLTGETALNAAMDAMGVLELNANMGKIVACPTAGSCGVLPGSLVTKGVELGKSDDAIVDALFTAAAIG